MEKISVFQDKDNKISTFLESCKLKVYFKANEKWSIEKEVGVDCSNLKSINDMRKYFLSLAKSINDCKIVVVNKAMGIPYNVFYGLDYSVWELDGEIEGHLDNIIKKELENINNIMEKDKEKYYTKISEGSYVVDLIELQIKNPEISSKKAIRPILKEKDFKNLQVKCCHIPPWIKCELQDKMDMKITEIKDNNYLLNITKS